MALPPCYFYAITGLHCPGCGATRAVTALLNGDISSALSFNWLLFPTLAVLVGLIGWKSLSLINLATNPFRSTQVERVVAVLALALVAFGVLRNIPGLELLAPHAS